MFEPVIFKDWRYQWAKQEAIYLLSSSVEVETWEWRFFVDMT